MTGPPRSLTHRYLIARLEVAQIEEGSRTTVRVDVTSYDRRTGTARERAIAVPAGLVGVGRCVQLAVGAPGEELECGVHTDAGD